MLCKGGRSSKKFLFGKLFQSNKWTPNFWLKLIFLSTMICGSEAIKCYHCTDTGGSTTCDGKTCSGKYCYKLADGTSKDEFQSTKKGCLHRETGVKPGTCKNQKVNLLEHYAMEGHWCVCDTDLCNGSQGVFTDTSHAFTIRNLLIAISFILATVYRFL